MKTKNVFIILLAIISVSVSLFYWFQLRPAQIKHDCSWVKVIEPAVPAHPAMTKEELMKKGLIKPCPTIKPKPISGYYDAAFEKHRAEVLCPNKQIIEKYSKSSEAIPEKINWRKATEEEYRFCLRDKGL